MRPRPSGRLVGLWLLVAACTPSPGPGAPAPAQVVPVQAGSSWAYILLGQGEAALIDTGSDAAGGALLAALAQHGLTPAQVRTIVLTHGHRQVRAAVPLFPRARLAMAAADVPLVIGLAQPRAPWARLQHRWRPAPPLRRPIQALLPGQRLLLAGHRLDVVALPGHTAGSLALVHPACTFVGDSLVWARAGWQRPSRWLSERPGDLPQALRRLRPYAPTWLASAQGGLGPVPDTDRAPWTPPG